MGAVYAVVLALIGLTFLSAFLGMLPIGRDQRCTCRRLRSGHREQARNCRRHREPDPEPEFDPNDPYAQFRRQQ